MTRLRVLVGGASIADESPADRSARRHVAHLRLLAHQLPLWSPETAQRVLRDAAARYEHELSNSPKRAA